jgi:hypothetical protein
MIIGSQVNGLFCCSHSLLEIGHFACSLVPGMKFTPKRIQVAGPIRGIIRSEVKGLLYYSDSLLEIGHLICLIISIMKFFS